MSGKAIDASYLCLKCRDSGHLVENCPRPWPASFSDQKWAYSPERIKMLIEQTPAKQSNTVCTRCRDLDVLTMFDGDVPWESGNVFRIAEITESQYYRNLGPVSSLILSRDCPLCVCLFALTPSPNSTLEEVHVVADWSIHRLERVVKADYDPKCQYDKCILVDLAAPDGEIDLSEPCGDALGLLRGEESAYISLNAQIVDPHQVDLNLIKRYLSMRERLHPITCSLKRSSKLEEIFLIDVETCTIIVYPGDGCEYLSLSYVWGYTYHAHFIPGQVLPKLPQTIEDAILLTQKLGKCYLWVDMMCIDQENSMQKLQQIRRMGDIYQGAYASIIALSGSSMDNGLSRFRTSTEGSVQPQLSCRIKDKNLIGLMPTLSQQTHNTSWGSRAWTLQEALLSCRYIYFSEHQVYFECNAIQCSESLDERKSWIHQSHRGVAEVDGGLDPDTYGAGTLRNAHAGKGRPKDPLQVYGVLATLYSYRHMTYSSDALYAFSAILQHLQQLDMKMAFSGVFPRLI